MSVATLYKLCAVKIGNTFIGQITDQEVTDNISEFLAADSSGNYNRAAAVNLSDARIRFSTQAVKTALGAIGLTGVDLATSNAVAYFAQYTAGGQLAADGCATFTFAKGIGLWRSLAGATDQLATASFELIGCSADGAASPIVAASGVTLPAITTKEMYVVGGATGVQSINIDTGISEVLARGDSDAYYTFAALGTIQPVVTYSQTTLGAFGAVTTLDSVSLVNVPVGGYRGTAPITFTFNQSMGYPTRIGGTPALSAFRITPTYNGTNLPIVIGGLT